MISFRLLPLVPILCFLPIIADAADSDPWGLEPKEAQALLEKKSGEALFLDVRDPVEIQFVGQPVGVDANVPYLVVDRMRWNPERNTLLLRRNPAFIQGVENVLAAKGLGRDAEIVTICRSGSERGRPSAALLRQAGFPNAKYVVHGFQGDSLDEGPQKGMRLKNGWLNSGLPWTSQLEREKIHLHSDGTSEGLLLILTSGSAETQAMAFVLAGATMDAGKSVRVLLCDDAGLLAVEGANDSGRKILPPKKSSREMLAGLVKRGALVEVCGIFLPTRDLDAAKLLPGITPASPHDIAAAITDPDVIVVAF